MCLPCIIKSGWKVWLNLWDGNDEPALSEHALRINHRFLSLKPNGLPPAQGSDWNRVWKVVHMCPYGIGCLGAICCPQSQALLSAVYAFHPFIVLAWEIHYVFNNAHLHKQNYLKAQAMTAGRAQKLNKSWSKLQYILIDTGNIHWQWSMTSINTKKKNIYRWCNISVCCNVIAIWILLHYICILAEFERQC